MCAGAGDWKFDPTSEPYYEEVVSMRMVAWRMEGDGVVRGRGKSRGRTAGGGGPPVGGSYFCCDILRVLRLWI